MQKTAAACCGSLFFEVCFMYEILNNLLCDQKGGVIFTCFGIWHWLYLLAIFGAIITIVCLFRRKNATIRKRVAEMAIACAFGLYILDFFLMPFAYGEIDLEKLPFHMCTAMCILCFMSRHNDFLGKYRTSFALLGLVSNLIYVLYPAGVGWYQIHPLSYRAVQTLVFHGTMTAYGIFVLALEEKKLHWRHCRKELVIIVLMTAWALLGNTLYNGTAGEYSHFFNWMFVKQDPFYLLPANIAPYVMPFAVVVSFFAADLMVYGVYHIVKKTTGRKRKPAKNR